MTPSGCPNISIYRHNISTVTESGIHNMSVDKIQMSVVMVRRGYLMWCIMVPMFFLKKIHKNISAVPK